MALDRRRYGLRAVSYLLEFLKDASHQLGLLSFRLSVTVQLNRFRDLVWTAFAPIFYNQSGHAQSSLKDF